MVGRLERGLRLYARQATGRMGRQTHTGDSPWGPLLIGTDHKVSAMCHLMWDCKQGQNAAGLQLPVTPPVRDQQGATEVCRGEGSPPQRSASAQHHWPTCCNTGIQRQVSPICELPADTREDCREPRLIWKDRNYRKKLIISFGLNLKKLASRLFPKIQNESVTSFFPACRVRTTLKFGCAFYLPGLM